MLRLFVVLSVLFLAVVIVTLPVDAPAKTYERRPRDPGVTDEQAEVFEVLDEVFPYEVAQRPFVEVGFTGRIDDDWRHRPSWKQHRHGFLIADDGVSFRVQFLDGERGLLEIDPRGTFEVSCTGYRHVDLLAHAHELVARARGEGEFWGPHHGEPIHPLTCALLVARALVRLGRPQDCAVVWRELPACWRTLKGLVAEPEISSSRSSPFVEDLSNRLALAFDDLSLSWQDLLERHDRWLAIVPCADGVREKVREQRDEIASAIAASRTLFRGSTQTIEELRDTARQSWGGSYAGTHQVDRWEPTSAAHEAFDRIVAGGLDRVPDLIAALDDRRPTRSTFFYSGIGGSRIMVCDVRGIATDALSMLYGGDDVTRTGSLISRMTADDWFAWYYRVRSTGLRPFLAAKMRDEADGVDAARSYLGLWPDGANAVLDVACAAPDATWSKLLSLVLRAATTDANLRERLVAVMRSTVDANTARRAFAARTLLQLGDTYGAETLRNRWQRGEPLRKPEWLVLLESGLPDVWQALEARLGDAPTRLGFAHTIRVSSRDEILERTTDATRSTIDTALRRCLLHLLTDASAAVVGLWYADVGVPVARDSSEVSLHRATYADLAACALATGWPDEFAFEPRATGRERRRQIEGLLHQVGLVPTRTAPPVPGPAKTLGTVVFEGDALPDDARAEVEALTGKTLNVRTVVTLLQRIATANAKIVALHCELPGDGYSIVVRFAARPVMEEDRAEHGLKYASTRDGDTSCGDWIGEGESRPIDAPEFSFLFYP